MSLEYSDFLALEYVPNESDLVCTFRLEPAADMSMEDAASRVASESSNGTWAALDVSEGITVVSAKAFDIDGNIVKVAYPVDLFEPGNLPQVLSCIAGNIMGMKAIDRIRLQDCDWPDAVVSQYPGPQFGPAVKTDLLDARDRPLLATVPKPKVGLSPGQHARIGYEAWTGGVDLLKDDENLTDQSFNAFEDRIIESFDERDRAEEETGERKDYLVNITAETLEMLRRAERVSEMGGHFVMVDIITAGWAGLQSVRDRCEELGLAIHAHRAMHAAFDRITTHGVSMRCLAQFARLAGVDHIHTGTANLGKLENEDTVGINEWLQSDLADLRPVMPVASGGLHPGLLPNLLEQVGTDIILQAGGGIHGHPDGTRAGARAMRQAMQAHEEEVSIEDASDTHEELAVAIAQWGTESPR